MEFKIENGVLMNVSGSSAVVEIPKSVRKIGDMPPMIFNMDEKTIGVVIHEGVTEISELAFWGNKFNEGFSVSEGNPSYKSIDGDLYTADGKTLVAYATGKNEVSFSVPKGVMRLAASSLSYSDVLEEIIIPDGVTEIGDYTFICCEALKRVVIPKSVVHIGKTAFWNCKKLERIEVDENNPVYKEIDGILYSRGGETLLQYACGRRESAFTVPDGVKVIGYRAFCKGNTLTEIRLPDSVSSIDDEAFSGCTSLERINIPDGVTAIGRRVFGYCKVLSEIRLPKDVTVIGECAFERCSSLESISIPYGVTSIEDRAFIGCEALRSICIPDSVTSIGSMVFQDCKSLREIVIPDSVEDMGCNSFCNCTSLRSAVISRNVTKIGKMTFYRCENLRNAVIPGNIASVGGEAFFRCRSLGVLNVSAETLSVLAESFDGNNGDYGADNFLICGVRGCLVRYAMGELSKAEEVILQGYVSRYFDKLCREVGEYPQFCRYFTDKKLISAKQAVDMLSQVGEAGYRATLISYAREFGGNVDIDTLLGIE